MQNYNVNRRGEPLGAQIKIFRSGKPLRAQVKHFVGAKLASPNAKL